MSIPDVAALIGAAESDEAVVLAVSDGVAKPEQSTTLKAGNCYLLVSPGEERRPFVWVGDKSSEDDKELAQQLAGQLEAAATTETMGEESEAFRAAFPDFVTAGAAQNGSKVPMSPEPAAPAESSTPAASPKPGGKSAESPASSPKPDSKAAQSPAASPQPADKADESPAPSPRSEAGAAASPKPSSAAASPSHESVAGTPAAAPKPASTAGTPGPSSTPKPAAESSTPKPAQATEPAASAAATPATGAKAKSPGGAAASTAKGLNSAQPAKTPDVRASDVAPTAAEEVTAGTVQELSRKLAEQAAAAPTPPAKSSNGPSSAFTPGSAKQMSFGGSGSDKGPNSTSFGSRNASGSVGGMPPPSVVQVSTHDKQNTVNASQLLKLGAFKLQPLKDFVTYDELLKLRLEDGIDPTRKEDYLSDEEFKKVFSISREEWSKMPVWKRSQKKKDVHLF